MNLGRWEGRKKEERKGGRKIIGEKLLLCPMEKAGSPLL
jgi:hypothetical protein